MQKASYHGSCVINYNQWRDRISRSWIRKASKKLQKFN